MSFVPQREERFTEFRFGSRQQSESSSLASLGEDDVLLDEKASQDSRPYFYCSNEGQREHANCLPNDLDASNRSASIPISNSMRRSSFEAEILDQAEAEADYQDLVFFTRVLNGIASQKDKLQDGTYTKYETELALNNILRTRHDGAPVSGSSIRMMNHYPPQHHRSKLSSSGGFSLDRYNPFGDTSETDPTHATTTDEDDLVAGVFELDL